MNQLLLMNTVCFWTSSVVLFYLKQCILSPSSGETYSAGPKRYSYSLSPVSETFLNKTGRWITPRSIMFVFFF
jgi:hypothetical protein